MNVVEQYITFSRKESTGKTQRWVVLNNRSGEPLGRITWYGSWRQYCFFPEPECVFNPSCLQQITDFTARLTKEHRNGH